MFESKYSPLAHSKIPMRYRYLWLLRSCNTICLSCMMLGALSTAISRDFKLLFIFIIIAIIARKSMDIALRIINRILAPFFTNNNADSPATWAEIILPSITFSALISGCSAALSFAMLQSSPTHNSYYAAISCIGLSGRFFEKTSILQFSNLVSFAMWCFLMYNFSPNFYTCISASFGVTLIIFLVIRLDDERCRLN